MDRAEPILTVAQMVAAEQALIDAGETVCILMERAGRGAADWVWRIAAGRPVTVLCGPGNNGGDGYVIARELHARGSKVAVIAPLAPTTAAAIAAREACGTLPGEARGGVLVDCLIGSGLKRPLTADLLALLQRLAAAHDLLVAVDLPSGIDADSGTALNDGLPRNDVTLALGAWKFAHWLMPAAATMAERRLVPIGVTPPDRAATLLERPRLSPPAADAHKYSRGLVLVIAGGMPGAAVLAGEAALRGGAGAVRLAADSLPASASPDIVLKPITPIDPRTGAVLIGPGLGTGAEAQDRLSLALGAGLPTVLDAEALRLLTPDLAGQPTAARVLTPHEGELAALGKAFGIAAGPKIEQAAALARATGCVVVAKGPDTVIAAPDGRMKLAAAGPSWLSVAGSGDVLAGLVASRLATGAEGFAAASEAVWLHARAARLAGPAFTASDLVRHVPAAMAAAL